MPGGDPRYVNLRQACRAGADVPDRTEGQARHDRLGQWDRVHLDRHARLGAGEPDRLALHSSGKADANWLLRKL